MQSIAGVARGSPLKLFMSTTIRYHVIAVANSVKLCKFRAVIRALIRGGRY